MRLWLLHIAGFTTRIAAVANQSTAQIRRAPFAFYQLANNETPLNFLISENESGGIRMIKEMVRRSGDHGKRGVSQLSRLKVSGRR